MGVEFGSTLHDNHFTVLCRCSPAAGASEHDLLSRIIETLGPPAPWMMAAAKRTSTFFTQVPAAAGGSSSSSSAAAAAAAAGGEGAGGYRLYTKEEFEAANKTQVSRTDQIRAMLVSCRAVLGGSEVQN
jgi:hypothetical protein